MGQGGTTAVPTALHFSQQPGNVSAACQCLATAQLQRTQLLLEVALGGTSLWCSPASCREAGQVLCSCWVVPCEDEFQRRVHPSYLVHIFILVWSLSILAAEDVLCAWVRRGG